jgi:hypothetical protein
MNTQDNNPSHDVLSDRLIKTQIGSGNGIIRKGRSRYDYSELTGKSAVSGMWKRECEIQVVVHHHHGLGGQDSRSLDG